MPRAILDTNVLIQGYRHGRESLVRPPRPDDCVLWARRLIDLRGTSAIVEPIYIEFVCGATGRDELRLYDAFIGEFDRVDGGHVLDVDWQRAGEIARTIGRLGRRRQLGDCLVRAIADRLRRDVITNEVDFPRKRH